MDDGQERHLSNLLANIRSAETVPEQPSRSYRDPDSVSAQPSRAYKDAWDDESDDGIQNGKQQPPGATASASNVPGKMIYDLMFLLIFGIYSVI